MTAVRVVLIRTSHVHTTPAVLDTLGVGR